MNHWSGTAALIVVDVQKGFDDRAFWGDRNNPECETNVARLIAAWRDRNWPIVFVRHESTTPGSPLAPGTPGNALKDVVTGAPDLLVRKSVHSAFKGTPDLASWLTEHGITGIAVCGIQTNMCCETTARDGSDLGFDMLFVLDATHTFDIAGPSHQVYRAREIARYTALTLEADFGRVVMTAELLD